jgi:hypothetical protein
MLATAPDLRSARSRRAKADPPLRGLIRPARMACPLVGRLKAAGRSRLRAASRVATLHREYRAERCGWRRWRRRRTSAVRRSRRAKADPPLRGLIRPARRACALVGRLKARRPEPPLGGEPRRAASIAAMSILRMPIIASNTRFAVAGSGSASASVRARGVICHDRPHLSLHQPHALSSPPLPMIAFHRRSVSAWSAVATWTEKASLCLKAGPPLRPRQGMPSTVNSTVRTSPCRPDG